MQTLDMHLNHLPTVPESPPVKVDGNQLRFTMDEQNAWSHP